MKLFALILFAACLASCSAVIAPKENRPAQVAYVGNEQHAGVLGWSNDGGVAIGDDKRAEYNALIDIWGTDPRLGTPLQHDAGVVAITEWTDKAQVHHTGKAWSIDREHVVKFSLMKSWQHRGDKPPGAIAKLINKL